MNLILWLMQSCLLSLAIFVLLGEELVLDHKHGGLLCKRAIPVAGEKVQQYPYNSQCCKLEKFSKWKIPFGLLAVVQTSSLLVIFGLRCHRKSPGPFLYVLCVACWVLTVILLLTKLVAHLSPEPQTVANTSYIGVLFTLMWNALRAVLAVSFQRIFHVIAHLTASADEREDLKNGFYFCSPEENKVLEGMGANIPSAFIVLMVAYFISSSYTFCLVLAHVEVEQTEETGLKPKRSTILQRCQIRRGDHENDSLDVGGEGEVQRNNTTDLEGRTLESRNCLGDLNKGTFSVGFVEESEDESFVFGWRL